MQRAIVFFSRALEEKQDGSRLSPPPLFAEAAVLTSLNLWCEVERRGAAERSGVGGQRSAPGLGGPHLLAGDVHPGA